MNEDVQGLLIPITYLYLSAHCGAVSTSVTYHPDCLCVTRWEDLID